MAIPWKRRISLAQYNVPDVRQSINSLIFAGWTVAIDVAVLQSLLQPCITTPSDENEIQQQQEQSIFYMIIIEQVKEVVPLCS